MSDKHYVIKANWSLPLSVSTEAADVLQVCALQKSWVFIIMMKRS